MSLASKDTGMTMSHSDSELTEKFPVRAAATNNISVRCEFNALADNCEVCEATGGIKLFF